MKKALFLDRDGVINIEKNYVYRISDFEFTPGIFELCLKYQQLDYLIFVITNQAGIARKIYTEGDFLKLTNWMLQRFTDNGIGITKVYYCPHHPDITGICSCRKPHPGMILQAAEEYDIDLKESVLIGDMESDIQAGRNAGIKNCIQVQKLINGRFKVKNTGISITNLDHAVTCIKNRIDLKQKGYVCVTNVRATYVANNDPDYCRIINNSFLTVPDGKPLEWYARLIGLKKVSKTSGPDLFNKICEISEGNNYTHFFYGSTPEIIEKLQNNLKKKYPQLVIKGAVSPPFKPVAELADERIIDQINSLKPTFVWIGLGAPKQERFIDLIINRIDSSILIGIGLVFDYEAGTVIRAPKLLQNIGLEWVYRFIQQPRLSVRSLRAFQFFIALLIKTTFARWSKVNYHSPSGL